MRKGQIVYEKRKLIEYYKVGDIFDRLENIDAVKCTYEGKIFSIRGGKSKRLSLPDYLMPFHNNYDAAL